MARVLRQMAEIDAAAAEAGLSLTRASAADVLGLRGVLCSAQPNQDTGPLAKALVADLPALLEAFDRMRQAEGAALGRC